MTNDYLLNQNSLKDNKEKYKRYIKAMINVAEAILVSLMSATVMVQVWSCHNFEHFKDHFVLGCVVVVYDSLCLFEEVLAVFFKSLESTWSARPLLDYEFKYL